MFCNVLDAFMFQNLLELQDYAANSMIQEIDTIVNVAPGDFNYDGKLDVLLSLQESDSTNNTYFHLYFGQLSAFGTHMHFLILL